MEQIDQGVMKFSEHPNLKLVDTTGAGDSFTAGFAVGKLEGMSD